MRTGDRVRRRYALNPTGATLVGTVERVWRPRYGGTHWPRRLGETMARVRFPDRTRVEAVANLEVVDATGGPS